APVEPVISLFGPPPLPQRRPAPPTTPVPTTAPPDRTSSSPVPAMPRPAGPASDAHRRDFDVPVGMGRRQQLLVEGSRITWRGDTIEADDITHLAYSSGDVMEVRL